MTFVPIDRASMELVWSDRGYPASGAYRDYHKHTEHHHNPWGNDGEAYDHERAGALAQEHAVDCVGAAPASACAATAPACRGAGWRCARSTPSCSVTGGMRGSPGSGRWWRSARGRDSSWCGSTTRWNASSRRG